MFRYRRPFSRDFLFFICTSLGWLLWGYFRRSDQIFLNNELHLLSHHYAYIAWAFFSSFVAIWLLYWIDFYRPFKGYKFVPDFLSIVFVLPVAGVLAKPVIGVLFLKEFFRTREIAFGAFLPALITVCAEGFVLWAKSKSPVKSTLYLALTPGETERFMESIKEGGWERYYRILTQEEFNGALATGGRVDYIVISRIATKNFILHQNILQAQMLGVSILDYRSLLNQLRGHISVHDTDLWTFLAGSVRQNWLQVVYRELKFYLEPVVAGILLVLLAPILIAVCILIKVTSPGPIFFRQLRTGYLGFNFELIKFRSMRIDAEAKGAAWATKNDDRVTPMGKFLRKSRLDELPQLWNVVKGEMSFIGPRPERPEFYDIIGRQVPLFRLRLLVRPGITGWAQLLGGYAASIEESERKLEFDLYYMQYLSPRMDIIIVGRTILTLLRGDSGR